MRYEKELPQCVDVLTHTADLNRKKSKKSQYERQRELLARR